MSHASRHTLLSCFALVLGLTGCGASGGEGENTPGGSGGPNGTGGNANGDGDGNSSGSGSGVTKPIPSVVCGASKVGAPRLRRLSRDELAATLGDVFPEVKDKWTSSLSADAISGHGFDNDSALLVVGKQTADQLHRTGDAIGKAVAGSGLSTLLPCSSSSPDAACAGQFIDKYGKRLFRRALSAPERDRYLALFQQVAAAKDFSTGIAFVTNALVQSPHFVYRREVGAANGKSYQLSPAEVATQLAYDFTGTGPSEALLARADAGELGTPAALEATARELLATERGLATVEKFFSSWLGYTRVNSVTKTNSPEFAMLREQMVAETRAFLGEVVVTQKGGLNQLLTAPFTTPSKGLANFYGLSAPASDYTVVQRAPGRGLGILAQASLLSVLAAPNASSPTRRGVMVMERFLCRERPPVPANIPEIKPPQPGQLTTRQRYETAHATGPCKTCHERFDPIGFGFEHFDEVGRYRDQDGGLPVDSVSYVPTADGQAHLFDFATLDELAQGLADQKLSYECATGFVSTYVHGAADECLGETKRGAFIDQQLGFLDYFASLAAEPHFSRRSLE
jgi:Protein of unknown function (DUF1588)/Protein of unknown function (DUF1592)/Protein of unknown function (DUF1595)/Protein of unknown function (DUF1587)